MNWLESQILNPPFVYQHQSSKEEGSNMNEQQIMRKLAHDLDARKKEEVKRRGAASRYPVPGPQATEILLTEQPYRGKNRSRGRACFEAIRAKLDDSLKK